MSSSIPLSRPSSRGQTPYIGLMSRIVTRKAQLGIIAAARPGAALATAFSGKGFEAAVYEPGITGGADDVLRPAAASTPQGAPLSACDVIIVAAPELLGRSDAGRLGESIRGALRPGQLIVLENAVLPGATRAEVVPALLESGLEPGTDFFLCVIPARTPAPDDRWSAASRSRVIAGFTPACLAAGLRLYNKMFEHLVPVDSIEAAELTRAYEVASELVNASLAEEMARLCRTLGVDVAQVMAATATHPSGFTPVAARSGRER